MCQAYNKTPSELYRIEGAAGLCFDTGIFVFARWVENELAEAENNASNEMFARSARARAFARCMGDDMSESTAGFTDPFARGDIETVDPLDGNFVPSDSKRKRRVQRPRGESELYDADPEDEIVDLGDLL